MITTQGRHTAMYSTSLEVSHFRTNPAGAVRALINGVAHRVFFGKPQEAPIEKKGVDIIVVVFLDEIDLSRKQAKSLVKFMPQDWMGQIIVVLHDTNLRRLRKLYMRRVMPEFGPLMSRVRVVDYYKLMGALTPSNGWVAQQAVKILASRLVETEVFLVLDAKNHFVRPFSLSNFFSESGRVRAMTAEGMPELLKDFHESLWPLMAESHKANCEVFGLEPASRVRLFHPLTPFLIHTRTARDLIAEIERRFNRRFDHFFCNTPYLLEIWLYGAFMRTRGNEIQELYEPGPKNCVYLWKHTAYDKQQFEEAMSLARTQHDVISIATHRLFLKHAPAWQHEIMEKYWADLGLDE